MKDVKTIGVKDFVRKISKDTGYTQKDITAVLETAEAVMIGAVKNGEGVKLFKTLTVYPTVRKTRMVLDPNDNKTPITIPEHIVPKAHFSKTLRDLIRE